MPIELLEGIVKDKIAFINIPEIKKVLNTYKVDFEEKTLDGVARLIVKKEEISDIFIIKKTVETSSPDTEAALEINFINEIEKPIVSKIIEEKKKGFIYKEESFNGEMDKSFIKKTLSNLAEKLNRDVYFALPHEDDSGYMNESKYNEILSSGALLIVSFGSFYFERHLESFDYTSFIYSHIYGQKLSCTDTKRCPSVGRRVIFDSTNKRVMTINKEKNVIYIPLDVCHHDYAEHRKAFEKMIEQIESEMNFDLDAYLAKKAKEFEEKKDVARGKFVTTIMNSSKSLSRTLGSEIKSLSDQIDRTKQTLAAQIKEFEDKSREATMLKNSEIEKEKVDKMYNDLYKNEKIHFIETEGNMVHVVTKKLYLTDEKTNIKHYVGVFDIKIDMNTRSGSGGGLTMQNLHFKTHGYRENMNAPHVWEGGSACMGNLASQLPPMIAAFEIDVCIGLVINFLEAANSSDGAGQYAYRWPIALYEYQSEEIKKKFKNIEEIEKYLKSNYDSTRIKREDRLSKYEY